VAGNTEVEQWDLGLNYWLHENVVFKLDFMSQDTAGASVDGFNLGVGYNF